MAELSTAMTRQTKIAKLKETMKTWKQSIYKGKATIDEVVMLDHALMSTGNRLGNFQKKPRAEGVPLQPLAERPSLVCNIDAQSVQASFMGWVEHRFRAIALYDFSHNDKNDVEDGIRDAKMWGNPLNCDSDRCCIFRVCVC